MKRKIQYKRLIPTARELEMYKMMTEGNSFHDIGLKYGVSRERIRQIFDRTFGMTAKDCARYKNSTARKIERKILYREEIANRKEQRYSKIFGCSVDVLNQINGRPFIRDSGKNSCPASKYYSHKFNASKRGIEWDMTFPEWWNIWRESGKWSFRGRGYGYVMARYGDSGAYKVGNVYICTQAQNSSDQYLVRRHHWARKTHLAATA